MIDFTKAEYNAVCHMRDKLSRMCAVRNAYGCAQCPLNEREGVVCPCLLLDIKIMEYELRHETDGD